MLGVCKTENGLWNFKWRQQTASRFVVFVGALRKRACIEARTRQPSSISWSSVCFCCRLHSTPEIKHLPTFPTSTTTLFVSHTSSSPFTLSIFYSHPKDPFSMFSSPKLEKKREDLFSSLHCCVRSLPHFMDLLQSRRLSFSSSSLS